MRDATGCVPLAGRTLTISNPVAGHANGPEYFTCRTSLQSVTHRDALVTGTGWPVRLRIAFPPGRVLRETGVGLAKGCEGDGDPNTIDLVVEIEGDGRTRGFADDAVKVKARLEPEGGIQVTGRLDCGPAPDDVHQDGIQVQGGVGIGFYDVEIGDSSPGCGSARAHERP